MRRRPFALAAAVLAAILGVAGIAAAPPQDRSAAAVDLCSLSTTERVVAVGDVHGAHDRFTAILRAAGLIDGRARWIGGRAILVQTGDVVDRGPHSRRAIDLLMRLERDAAAAGGAVYALLGNHEVMRMMGHWQDVSPEEYAAFRTPDSADLREAVYENLATQAAREARDKNQQFDSREYRRRFMREVPLGFIEMRQAFGSSGTYGGWLRQRPAIIKVNDVVFVHGGLDVESAMLGCAAINDQIAREVAGDDPPLAADLPVLLATKETGPLWYRGFATAPDPDGLPDVEAALRAVGGRTVVVGHSPVNGGRITTRFGGRVVLLDTGMLGGRPYPNGRASALEIHGDAVTAIYADGRETLPSLPALASQ